MAGHWVSGHRYSYINTGVSQVGNCKWGQCHGKTGKMVCTFKYREVGHGYHVFSMFVQDVFKCAWKKYMFEHCKSV